MSTPAAPAVVDLLLRPDAFFVQRRPRIDGWFIVAISLVFGLTIIADQHATLLGSANFRPSVAGRLWAFLLVGGPLRWFVGAAWFRARVKWSGARDADSATAANIFGLTEMIRAVPLIISVALDLAFSPVAGAVSPTLLLGTMWSQVAAYRAVRAAFPVSARKARVWFLLIPGLFYTWLFLR